MSVTNTGASPDHPRPDAGNGFPQAVLFDLLTALLDSWTVWNAAAGSEPQGRAWRAEYLRRTYGCGACLPYEQLVAEAAEAVGLPASAPAALEANWGLLPAWDGARELLAALRPHSRLGVVTNCSRALGHRAAALLGVDWDVVVTSEEAGYYKPDPRPYQLALARLDVQQARRLRRGLRLRSVRHQPRGPADLLAQPRRPGAAARAPEPERQSPGLAEALPWLARFDA